MCKFGGRVLGCGTGFLALFLGLGTPQHRIPVVQSPGEEIPIEKKGLSQISTGTRFNSSVFRLIQRPKGLLKSGLNVTEREIFNFFKWGPYGPRTLRRGPNRGRLHSCQISRGRSHEVWDTLQHPFRRKFRCLFSWPREFSSSLTMLELPEFPVLELPVLRSVPL